MAERRPIPPSARRRSLARAAGLHASSPLLVGALACAAAVLALTFLGPAAATYLGDWVTRATTSASLDLAATSPPSSPSATSSTPSASSTPSTHAASSTHTTPAFEDVPRAVVELAMPLLAALALAALVGHLAQTRSLWLPRRRLRGAPALDPHRVRTAAFELASMVAIGALAFAWLWLVAPRLAALPLSPLAGVLLVTSFLATLAIAWVALGVGDALVRHADLATALHMTATEKREDDRLAGADPRWQQRRATLAREASRQPRRATSTAAPSSLRGASLLLLGDDVAVAIAWDPIHRPVPTRIARGRGARATQLLALARHAGVRIHRDHALATALAASANAAPTAPNRPDDDLIPEAHWPRLADLIAATTGAAHDARV